MAFGQVSGLGFSSPEWLSGAIERNWALRDREDAQNFSAQSAQAQMQFQADMSGSAYQRAVADMSAAGLNPMLAYQQGGASSPQGAGFAGILPHKSSFGTMSGSINQLTAAQVAHLNAQTSKTFAEKDEVVARTPSHEVERGVKEMTMAKYDQEIKESAERVRLMVQQAKTSAAQSAVFAAQVPEIQQHIRTMASQAKMFAEHGKVFTAEERQLQQRIKANLPEIDRMIKEIEHFMLEHQKAGRFQTDTAQRSWLGAWDRLIKGLTGRLGQ